MSIEVCISRNSIYTSIFEKLMDIDENVSLKTLNDMLNYVILFKFMQSNLKDQLFIIINKCHILNFDNYMDSINNLISEYKNSIINIIICLDNYYDLDKIKKYIYKLQMENKIKMFIKIRETDLNDFISSTYISCRNLIKKSENYNSFSNLTFTIGKKPNDSMEVWKKIIESITPMNNKISQAIINKYGSLKSLYLKYFDDTISEDDKKLLLSNIEVEKLKNGNKTVGEEISTEIYNYFMKR